MAKKHMKKCSPSLAIKEMQIKTTLRFHFTPVRIVIIKTPPTTSVGEDVGKRNPNPLLVGMQAGATTLEKNLNIDLPYDPAIPLLGIYPKKCNTGYSRGTCTPMFISVLFTFFLF
jgi:hypothetical protein